MLPEVHPTSTGGVVGELADIGTIVEFNGLPRPKIYMYGGEAHDFAST